MRLLCLYTSIFFALLLTLPLISTAAQDLPAVARQELKVILIPDKHLVKGESTITYAAGPARVFFNLSSAAVIDGVSVAGMEVPYSFKGGALAIDLPVPASRVMAPLQVRYHISYNKAAPDRPVAIEDPSYGITGTISPAGTFLGSDAMWYPTPQVTPRLRRTEVIAPAGVEAITSGKRLHRQTKDGISISIWEEKKPVGELSLSAGPYIVQERHVGGVDLYTYLYRENARLASTYLDAAAKYIGIYSEMFGPYPFDKFAAVENFFPTGYGYPSYTLLGSTVIRLPFIVETSFPHEIAHCWWGNGVQVDVREGNWSEGLVTYLADYLLEERKSAVAAKDYRLRLLSDYATLVKPGRDFPLQAFMGRMDPASRTIGYGKGAMVFHMVRQKIGDQAFFKALKNVSRDKLFKAATWSDFTRAFSSASGSNLEPFMQQWLTRSGGPHISFEQVSRRRKGAGWQVSGSILQTVSPYYNVTVPLRVETEKGALLQKIHISGKTTAFSFTSRYRPQKIMLDPEASVFRILSAAELPPTVNHLKGSEKLTLVMTANCLASPETLHDLLESLGQGDAPVVAEDKLEPANAAQRELLFCGVPQNQRLSFPTGISTGTREFVVDGKQYKDTNDLLFAATQHPTAEGKMAAVFLPLSENAAERYVLKITHYGKYGYLVFSGGENQRKGLFSPSGTVVEFRDRQ